MNDKFTPIRKEPKKYFSVRIPQRQLDAMNDICIMEGMKKNHWISYLIDKEISRLKYDKK